MKMKTYWDLSEKERAELSSEDVERFAAAELMLKGVLASKPLELVNVPAIPEPDVELFIVDGNSHLGYKTHAEAEQVAAQATEISTRYLVREWSGPSVQFADHDFARRQVKAVRVYSSSQIDACRAQLEKALSAKEENARRKAAHETSMKAEREALAGMWADWHECGGKSGEMRRVTDVFAEYVRTAGDAVIAARFLLRVFTAEQIREAAEWCGVEIPLEPEAVAAE